MKEEREGGMVELWGEEDGKNGCSVVPPLFQVLIWKGRRRRSEGLKGGAEAHVRSVCVFKWEQAEELLGVELKMKPDAVGEKEGKKEEKGALGWSVNWARRSQGKEGEKESYVGAGEKNEKTSRGFGDRIGLMIGPNLLFLFIVLIQCFSSTLFIIFIKFFQFLQNEQKHY